ncbi:helix-turn-helix domain-containing protein [Vulgatibacter sp.]|uniref:helix-turn-helix domain-containing protein n=1 Tax=Vulgatibacter sp. TaxID=1971226 RepID=UPI0035687A1C
MESFGRYLAQQRELRGLELVDVARETKLSPAAIQALEGERFDELPARVFVVGYLRAYARAVGLGPDELVARYDEWRRAMGLPESSEPAAKPAMVVPPAPSPWPWMAGLAAPFLAALAWWLLA